MLAFDIVPLKTFVIERQALIAKALHSFLNENPMIRVVGDAPSVRVEDLQRTRPDLIVFGLDNALLDVSEALALARSVCPNVRFCVLSSFANSDVMQRSIASGADGFVVKDISPSELDVAFRLLASGRKEALVSTKASGAVAKLTEKQTQWLAKTLSSKNPAQMQFPIALWTREIIRELIKRRFGVNMALTSVGNLMRRLGFSVQRPLMRAYERNPEAVKHWLEVGYPDIQKMAKKHHAMIFFEDESGIRSDYRSGTTWAPRGQRPVVERTGKRISCNMLSAVSARGELRFMVTPGRVGAAAFTEFLKRLVHGVTRPIFLIVDGHPSHRAKMTKRFVESLNGKLRLFFLPGYSPDLNPDELV